jgi:peptide-methionine (S)-S-oxide reductase
MQANRHTSQGQAGHRRHARALAAPAVVALMLLLGAGNPTRAADAETAIFAGGCFWCVEADFDKIPGVIETVSGYTGGHTQNPTYKQVTGGDTGHYEAVRIRFDPDKVGYAELVSALLRSVDPTDDGGQFCDRGASYRTAIFTQGTDQTQIAEARKAEAEKQLGTKIVTPVLEAGAFYPAEDYHQDFHERSPRRYTYYRWSCGRDKQVRKVWGENAYKGIPGKPGS